MARIPTLLADFYKISHKDMYLPGTEYVYSTWTPRASRVEGVSEVVAFGFQAFVQKYLIDYFRDRFFLRSEAEVVAEYKRTISATLGIAEPDATHIAELHGLGYLPILIKAVPEGTRVPLRVPMLTIENTDPRFFWLTNYLETLMSCELWLPCTSATTSHHYRKLLQQYAEDTGDPSFVPFQGHDFSMRGMSCLEASEASGAAHLLSFVGTDTIPAIGFLEQYYNADVTKELIGTSIPASEHSCMQSGAMALSKQNGTTLFQGESDYYLHLLTKVHPAGFVSLVSDTWDFWAVLERIIRPLKDVILARDGKVVIRPDSGDPVLIICGDPQSPDPLIRAGAVETLWGIFGGTINEKGFKCLDSHIGCIYGDAITVQRCAEICERLKAKGFATTNVVYGIGSFSMQYCTRDTYGFALKSTHVVINEVEYNIFKDPVTDVGHIKKSQTGRVAVVELNGVLGCVDGLSRGEEVSGDLLTPIFQDGGLVRVESLSAIRERLAAQHKDF